MQEPALTPSLSRRLQVFPSLHITQDVGLRGKSIRTNKVPDWQTQESKVTRCLRGRDLKLCWEHPSSKRPCPPPACTQRPFEIPIPLESQTFLIYKLTALLNINKLYI